jgi:hypothetical protein
VNSSVAFMIVCHNEIQQMALVNQRWADGVAGTMSRYVKGACKFDYYYYCCYYCGSTALCCTLAAFSVSGSYTHSVGLFGQGISPLQGLCLHTEQHKHKKTHTLQTCMPWVGFEPTISVFERAKTIHALNRPATVNGRKFDYQGNIPRLQFFDFNLEIVSIPYGS